MHEVGVAKEVLSIVLGKAAGKKVTSISVELGNDGHTTPASLEHAFSMVSKDTPAAGARLKIRQGAELESRVLEFEVKQ